MKKTHRRILFPLCCLCSVALADSASEPPSCISVEVNGQRSPSYDCLSRMMAPDEQAVARSLPQFNSAEVTKQGGNALGLFNRAATQIRMGSNLGRSVYPNQPAPAPVPNPLVPR